MINLFLKTYAFLFARKIFFKMNYFLYHISLRGLGILNFQGEYLTGEKDWLKLYLPNKQKPIVFDVGANVGNYSKDVFESNPNSLVFSFEPHPKTYKKLIENIKNPNFKSFNIAVGKEEGLLNLYDYNTKDGSAHASLYKDVIKDIHKGTPIHHSVNIIKLDKFLVEQDLDQIDLLKIDTEGNEYNVLLGIKDHLENNKIKAIHFEFNEMNIISKVTFKDFWDILKNYRIYRILPFGALLEIKKYSPITCEIYAFQNIVAILKDPIK